VLANGIKQARKQEISGRMGARQEACDQILRASAFPLLPGKVRQVDEGTIGFVTVQEAFFEEAIERRHYCGVRERATELGDNVADAAFSARPENFH